MFSGWYAFRPMFVVACCGLACALAAAKERTAAWTIHIKTVDLKKNHTTAILRSEDGRSALEIRCIPNEGLRADIVASGNKSNVDIHIKYQADQGSVTDDKAWPSGDKEVILPNSRQILEDALKASTLHIQMDIVGSKTTRMLFRPRGAPKALSQIRDDCPSEAQPPDSNGQAK